MLATGRSEEDVGFSLAVELTIKGRYRFNTFSMMRTSYLLSVGAKSLPVYLTHKLLGCWSENNSRFTPMLPLDCKFSIDEVPGCPTDGIAS